MSKKMARKLARKIVAGLNRPLVRQVRAAGFLWPVFAARGGEPVAVPPDPEHPMFTLAVGMLVGQVMERLPPGRLKPELQRRGRP
jgi:hypothetical protein